MSDYIKKGDIVNIYWETVPAEFGLTVTSPPIDGYPWWGLKRKDGTPINVYTFAKMERVKETADAKI